MTPPADTLILNVRALTMDPDRPRAEAVALRGDRILAVGTRAEARAAAAPGAQVIDGGGATLLPGLIESHLHLFPGGAELEHLQLVGLLGPEAVADAVAAHAAARPEAPVLIAQGAHYGLLGAPMDRHALDRLCPDRPLLLMAADHHTGWANTAALEAAGILKGRALRPGNEIVMGPDGLAAGPLLEFEAFAPVLAAAGEDRAGLGLATGREPDPAPTPAQRAHDKAMLARGLAHCARHGFTSLINMDGNRYTLDLLAELRAEGRLTARVRVPFHFRDPRDLSDLAQAEALRRDFADDWLACDVVKLFMDGVIESGTGVLLEDYPGRPGWRGDPLFDADRFARLCTEIDRRGFRIAVHAIGDGAVRRTLDGLAAARAANGPRDARHRIEHIELLAPEDLPRLAGLGVTASLQPAHVPGAMDFPPLGPGGPFPWHRRADAYPCARLAAAGVPLVFASDWPVADVSALRGIKAAVTRAPFAPDCPDERVGLHDALAAWTRGGAFAEGTEDRKGMLRPGFLADLTLLSGDIEAVAPEAIDALSVARTIVGGRQVFGPA